MGRARILLAVLEFVIFLLSVSPFISFFRSHLPNKCCEGEGVLSRFAYFCHLFTVCLKASSNRFVQSRFDR